jgi:transposase InsO family protein
LTSAQKRQVIRELRQQGISLRLALDLVKMARASFYRDRRERPQDNRLRELIRDLALTEASVGYRRITAVLRRQGWRVKDEPVPKAQPYNNGHPESFNGSLRDELLDAELFHTLGEARAKMESWLSRYNGARPHQSLRCATPQEWWEAAPQGAPDNFGPPPPEGWLAKRSHVCFNPTLS